MKFIRIMTAVMLLLGSNMELAMSAPGSTSRTKLTAPEAKKLAQDTLSYFAKYEKSLADDAVMDKVALFKVFGGDLQSINNRWPPLFSGDAEAEKYSNCQNLIGSASAYAYAQHDMAFNNLAEEKVLPLRKIFKSDRRDCRRSILNIKS